MDQRSIDLRFVDAFIDDRAIPKEVNSQLLEDRMGGFREVN